MFREMLILAAVGSKAVCISVDIRTSQYTIISNHLAFFDVIPSYPVYTSRKQHLSLQHLLSANHINNNMRCSYGASL